MRITADTDQDTFLSLHVLLSSVLLDDEAPVKHFLFSSKLNIKHE